MKKLIFGLGIIAVGFSSSFASANDSWRDKIINSLYIGGNVGVISHAAKFNEEVGHGFDGKTFLATDVTLGVRGGFDWYFGCGLIGAVAEWDYSNVSQSYNDGFFMAALDQYSTIRARVGIKQCNCLLYLTTGAAYAHIKNHDSVSWNESRWGWTGGFGAEVFTKGNFSFGVDLLYMDFNDRSQMSAPHQRINRNDSVWVSRFILNYRLRHLLQSLRQNAIPALLSRP